MKTTYRTADGITTTSRNIARVWKRNGETITPDPEGHISAWMVIVAFIAGAIVAVLVHP